MRFSYRLLSFAAGFLFLAGFAAQAHSQSFLKNSEASVSVFAQSTSNVSGNGVTDDPTESMGGQVAFRHSYHWWLGFEGSYDYTRFSEHYSNPPYAVQHNNHEFGASYLVSGTSILGFRPFVLGGVSALVFSPSLNGGQNVSWQGEPALNYGAGINHALLSSHFGIRLQYRGVYAKAPDFGRASLDAGKSRLTSEPMGGVYLRF
jgi:Outer membrane protein beta-barrel domain